MSVPRRAGAAFDVSEMWLTPPSPPTSKPTRRSIYNRGHHIGATNLHRRLPRSSIRWRKRDAPARFCRASSASTQSRPDGRRRSLYTVFQALGAQSRVSTGSRTWQLHQHGGGSEKADMSEGISEGHPPWQIGATGNTRWHVPCLGRSRR